MGNENDYPNLLYGLRGNGSPSVMDGCALSASIRNASLLSDGLLISIILSLLHPLRPILYIKNDG
jgi:hypothetical protein